MLVYGISLFIALFERSETRKSKNTIVNDLSQSDIVYDINEVNFNLAHMFRRNAIFPMDDDSYLNVKYYQVSQSLNAIGSTELNSTEYGYTLCNESAGLSNIDYLVRTGLINHAQCPVTQSYEVSGTLTSSIYQYVQIKLSK